VTNHGTCPFCFLVPAGTIVHSTGFTERVITGLVLGDKLAPHPKTEYRFGDEEDQAKLGGNLPVLERTLQLWRTRQIDLKGQAVDNVIQRALWVRIEKMSEDEFTKAYIDLVRKNFEKQKMKWDKAEETRMLASGHDLWARVEVVLQ